MVPDFSASVTSGCLPVTVSFKDLSTGNPDKRIWDFGDGRTSFLTDPGVLYLLPGSYTVKLTIIKDADSVTIVKPGYINVYEYPEVDFHADVLSGCSPLPVKFTDLSKPGSGTIETYKWDFGDGNSGNVANPTHIYKVTGRYNVTLFATNSFGCMKSKTIPNYIRILDSVMADFDPSILPACGPPFPVNFTDKSVGVNIIDRNWRFGDGNISTQQNPVHNYGTQGIYNIQLITTNGAGCKDTVTKELNITIGNFEASFTAPDSVCRGPLVKFTNTSVPLASADSVFWDFGDGTFSKAVSPSKGYTNKGVYTVTMKVFFNSCVITATRSIKILEGPKTQFSGTPLQACVPPLTVNFTNETVDGRLVRWNLGNGQSNNYNNPVGNYVNPGSYTVTFITVNDLGCYDTLRKVDYVKIAPPSISKFTSLPYEGCFPWTNTFRSSVTSLFPITSWKWDFGDGRTSTEENPTVTFSERGNYVIKLIVATDNGCADTISSTVKGGLKPKIDFFADPLVVCPSDNVSFQGNIQGLYDSLKWEFGDGGKAYNIDAPKYMYKDTGYMDVTLYAYDNGCVDSLIRLRYIYVSPPYANFGVTVNCIKPYERVFSDSSIGATIWQWDFGNGDSSNERNPTYTYKTPGRYSVTLTVSDGKCSHYKSSEVIVIDEKPDINAIDAPTCSDNIVRFIGGGSDFHLPNIASINWRFSDNGAFQNLAFGEIQRKFTSSQVVTLRMQTFDLNGCSRAINKVYDIKIGGPKAIIKPNFQFACVGNKVIFTDSTIRDPIKPVVKWTWNFGNGNDSVYTSPPFETVYHDTGYYNIFLKVEDINGCKDSIKLNRGVGVFKPTADFETADTIICPNTEPLFINNSKGKALSYRWDFGDGDYSLLKIPRKKFIQSGIYDVTLKINDTAGCVSILERPKYINVGGVKARFELSDSFASCPPLFVNFTDHSSGAIQHLWDFDNGNTSLLINPIQTFNQIDTFNVKLIITGTGGCTDSMIRKVTIRGPQGTLTYGPLSGCPPMEVRFSSNSTNVKSYIWDFSDGNTELGSDSVTRHTYLNPGTYRPRVILEDGQNCRIPIIGAEDIKIVGVRSLIRQLNPYTYCDSATISFGDSSITNDAIRRWHWDFGDGDTSNLSNPVHTYTKPGNYVVSLFVETFDGCNSFYILPSGVKISSSPKLTQIRDSTFCLPGKILFRSAQQATNVGNLTWNWDFGNGMQSALAEPDTVLYDKTGVFLPKVVVTNEFGCTDSKEAEITVYESAETYIVNIGAFQYCNTATILFKDSSTNANIINRWQWDFGDGNTSPERNPVHTFDKPGRYNVSLSVFTDRNCVTTNILNGQIIVAPTPLMDLVFDSSKCTPAKIGFASTWLNPDTTSISYHWDFGNGITSSKRIPDSVLYSNFGTYPISLKASNEYGCADSVIKILRINDMPKVIAGGINPGVLCDSAIVNFNGNVVSNDPIHSWTWNFGDGESSSLVNPAHMFNKKGKYKVTLTVNSIYNCSSSGVFNTDIVVTESPRIKLEGDAEICIPDSAKFKATWLNNDNRPLQWNWRFGNGSWAAKQDAGRVLYSKPGTYTIEAVAKDLNGCRDSLTIQLLARDTPRLVVTAANTTCLGTGVNLTATGAESYKWEAHPTLSCLNCANPIATPSARTTYTVTGSNGTMAGCVRQKSVSINVITPIKVLSVQGDSICVGDSYQLLASGGTNYLWSPASGLSATNIANPVARPLQSTTYMVVASDILHCFKDTAYVPVIVYPKPTVKVKEKLIKGIAGTGITLQTESENATRWRWSPSVGLSCVTCPEPQLVITQSITYTVSVTNPGGCEAKDDVTIEPLCATNQVFVPNTFSPNGDGRNDLFYPMGRGVAAIKSLRVFNRWGEVVFERNSFMANDPSAGWNGTYKGRTLSADVYVYVMVVLCFNNQTVEMKGNVTLLQ